MGKKQEVMAPAEAEKALARIKKVQEKVELSQDSYKKIMVDVYELHAKKAHKADESFKGNFYEYLKFHTGMSDFTAKVLVKIEKTRREMIQNIIIPAELNVENEVIKSYNDFIAKLPMRALIALTKNEDVHITIIEEAAYKSEECATSNVDDFFDSFENHEEDLFAVKAKKIESKEAEENSQEDKTETGSYVDADSSKSAEQSDEEIGNTHTMNIQSLADVSALTEWLSNALENYVEIKVTITSNGKRGN